MSPDSQQSSQLYLLNQLQSQSGGIVGIDPNAIALATQTVPQLGPISETVDPLSYFQAGGAYPFYEIEPRFTDSTGLVEMAPTNPDSDVAFAQVSAPTLRLVLKWAAEREGQPPVIPDTNLAGFTAGSADDPGPVLLSKVLVPGLMERMSGGLYRYRVGGEYTYGFKKPALVKKYAAVSAWSIDAELQTGALNKGINQLFIQAAAQGALGNTTQQLFSIGPKPVQVIKLPQQGVVGA